MRFSCTAPAKINLFLRVTGERADHYHTLETVFYPLPTLHDTLIFEPVPDASIPFEIVCEDPMVPTDARNLIFKAADRFYAQRPELTRPAWRVTLQKNIPVCAGLGGGSTDAAATLTFLNAHHGHPFSSAELTALAASLGADVPFFLNPVPALARGIGDVCTPIEAPKPLHLMLVAPEFPVPAAWAYAHFHGSTCEETSVNAVLEALKNGTPDALGMALHNDLAPAVFEKFPALALYRDFLLENGACGVELSGSGPTLFALCASAEALERTFEKCAAKYPFCRTIWL